MTRQTSGAPPLERYELYDPIAPASQSHLES
jgi:hypothetical protein